MMGKLGAAALLTLAVAIPVQDAAAQSPLGGALFGGATGAIIGGAVGGGRGAAIGAAIGAATGAIIAAEGRRVRGGYYHWRNGCYIQQPDGVWVQVAPAYCGPPAPPPPPAAVYAPPPPPAVYAAPPHPRRAAARCAQLTGFDPASRTYVGRDGRRHPCP
jgi:hypothetical protein